MVFAIHYTVVSQIPLHSTLLHFLWFLVYLLECKMLFTGMTSISSIIAIIERQT